jgi:predicted regulator of Ras-like GTPase activity (Roadblock/LC7/MglB family)
MNTQTETSGFEEILHRMNKDGFFIASVLASEDGLPVASAPTPSPYDADTVAAMVTLVKDFIKQTQTRLGLAEVDEVSMVVGDRSRLVCRYFGVGAQSFVLAVLAPPNQSYRRLTARAVREFQEILSSVH